MIVRVALRKPVELAQTFRLPERCDVVDARGCVRKQRSNGQLLARLKHRELLLQVRNSFVEGLLSSQVHGAFFV